MLKPLQAPPKKGDLIAGKFQVESVIGTGGMGFVVAARHLQLAERVAVKMLRFDKKSSKGLERMLREARACARLRGEHVARVMDCGVLDDGRPYVAMELAQGRNLAHELAAGGAASIETAVDYVLQVCEALAQAHAIGIVHRDIKPSNLVLTQRTDGSP